MGRPSSWSLVSESGDTIWSDEGNLRQVVTFVDGEFNAFDQVEKGRFRFVDLRDIDGLGCAMVADAIAAG